MKDEEKISRILVTQMDAGNLHVVRRNAVYKMLSQRLEELRAEYVARHNGSAVDSSWSDPTVWLNYVFLKWRLWMLWLINQPAVNNAAAIDVHAIISRAQIDTILGLDVPVWRPWM